ncbi:ribonuclease 3-like protein 1 isoform X4 [Capsella rubella]|uniref:ribonuclease 3-like protein 1 isoform X4 n=1 Tax=Capsella rubella TaxID=81985 RepID=UPI000CD50431|nr:ribonuclease 3-like protein 1 isoform X4 [Capsella rubella]
MKDRETKRIGKKPFISLRDIPPLDPSSIPTPSPSPSPSLSLKPRAMMVQDDDIAGRKRFDEKSELKLKNVIEVDQDNAFSSFSNIQIDPNSTRTSVISITPEKNMLVPPKPEEAADTKPNSKDESKRGSAKSVLHEICASKRWRPPLYECCKVDGPSHMRLEDCFGVFWGSHA